jgi:hypothetical protein
MPIPDDIHKIRFIGGPLDSPEQMKAAAELWRTIGLAACTWARLEQHIDAVLIYLNQPKHSEKLCDPEHPIGFRRKVRLLKRWFNRYPALAEHRKTIREISTDLLILSKTRNAFLHSILDDYNPSTRTAIFRSVQAKAQNTYVATKHEGTIDNLLAFASRTHAAHLKLAGVSPTLFTPDAIERLRKP